MPRPQLPESEFGFGLAIPWAVEDAGTRNCPSYKGGHQRVRGAVGHRKVFQCWMCEGVPEGGMGERTSAPIGTCRSPLASSHGIGGSAVS